MNRAAVVSAIFSKSSFVDHVHEGHAHQVECRTAYPLIMDTFRIPPFPLLWSPFLLPYSTTLMAQLQKKYSIDSPPIIAVGLPPSLPPVFPSPLLLGCTPSPTTSQPTSSNSSKSSTFYSICLLVIFDLFKNVTYHDFSIFVI
uniref:Uncharacterized protein n=1 Tax=Heterorhabditis bacteriophora TaxID=37862 RepID=A0A1I7WIK3_HETBA